MFIVCCYPIFAQHARNPLLKMVGKVCGEYFDEYEVLCDSLFSGDSLAREELVRLFSEAAAADPTGAWELDRRRIAGHVRFYESRRGGYMPSADYRAEMFAEELLDIARAAAAKGFQTIQLRALFDAGDVYRIFAHEYEQAFACYLEAADGVAEKPLSDFPWKFYLYLEIGDFYFSFREYADAVRFYRRIADDPEAALKNNHRLYPALNGLGLCYRSGEEFAKSDSCFLRILDLSAPIPADRYVWEGIAGGNIGRNHLLRGDSRQALAWMEPALEKMKRPEDDSYTAHLAADIADIYFKRDDLPGGRKYLDTALRYHRRSGLPEKSSRLLEVQARYHALGGDRREAAACLDSALRAKDREQEAFSGLVLRRVEQQFRSADRKAHEERLGAEKMRSRMYRHIAILIACTLAVITLLLLLVAFYYRRTHRAYRELVRKSQQWAGVATDHCGGEPPVGDSDLPDPADGDTSDECPAMEETEKGRTQPEAFDRTVMHAVEQAVIDEKMFKQADLTLDMLSAATGYSRYYLSTALNRCTGANFNTYVNEQRIKEAVRLMSDPVNADLTVDAIAYDSGFNDRKNFYRVFKRVTGLSPTQFRRNVAA